MSSAESRAVFISYSSDDVEAAQRIATALHEAGIEVWFDRSELRGGDAWDQNIRRQIKECALFLPIISQTTERRPEGYFRLEWRLADNRTHHMGRTKSFLVPVCIDASVNQSFADVPDSFLAVHWTLLPSGEPNQGFVDNVKTLLSGPTAADAGRTRPSFPVGSRAPRAAHDESGSAVASRSPWLKRALIGTAVVAVLAVLGFVGFLKKAVATAETRIAVLQFEDLSDTPNAATGFAGGLQEEIIRKLGSLAGFTVLPPTSVSQYRDNPKSVFDMARELTTGYFVMGSVTRTADNKLQVTASLMTPSNNSVWDKRYDPVDGADRLAAQATVGTAIAEAVKTALAEQQKTQAAKKPTGSVNPFSTYTEAFNAFGRDRVTAAGLKALEQKLQAVVDDSPDFAAAWDLLGVVHSLTFAQGFDASAERLASARKAIETAVKLDPDLPDTIRSEGIFLAEALRDYPAAIAKFEALQLALPNSADSYGYLGAVYRHQGKWTEAMTSLQEARDLDAGNLTHLRTLEQLQVELRSIAVFNGARQTRTEILNFLTPGAAARGGAGRGPQQAGAAPGITIRLIPDRPDESYRQAVLGLLAQGNTSDGDDLFKGLNEAQAKAPRVIALKTDWLRRTNRLDDAIALDKQQPAFGDDGEPAWRQAIDLAAAYAAKGDTAGARGRLAGVTDDLKARLVSEPGNRRLNSWLGLAEALLGEREAALKHGQEAVRLATEEGDAVALPAAKLRLALIQSWTNDLDAAFAGLAALLPKEGLEITVPAMKLDPWFAKLRADARFGTLAADPKNNAPLISDLSGRGGRSGRGGPGGPGGQNIRGGFAPNGQIPVDQRGGRGNRQGNGQFPPQTPPNPAPTQ